MNATDHRPNVLFILVDQLRYDCLGCNGNDLIRTPHIDRLAEQGMRFERCYTPIPLCTPARASLLTGLFPHNHHAFSNVDVIEHIAGWDGLAGREHSFAARLTRAGYQTAYTGKWHLGPSPHEYGFQHVRLWDDDNIHHQRYRQKLRENVPMQGAYRNKITRQLPNGVDALLSCVEPGPDEYSRPHFVAETGIDLMNEVAATPDRPFFLSVNFWGPHLPFYSHEPWSSMYDPKSIPPWPSFSDTLKGKPFQQRRQRAYWNTEGLPWEWWQPIVANYMAFISIIDAEVGRLLSHLDQLGLADNTIVCFTTDHGDSAGDRGMFDKGYCMYEELVHVPMIARGPGVCDAGAVNRDFVSLLDLPCTWLDAAGAEPFDACDGRSLRPLFEGSTPPDWRRDIVSEFHGMQWALATIRMIRDERYKFIFNGTDMDELYDLEADPAELTNLAPDPAHAETRARMRALLFSRLHESRDHFATWLTPPATSVDR